jgi:hypothetical protein
VERTRPRQINLLGAKGFRSDWLELAGFGAHRRCQLIVVSAAGCDPNFAFRDLGNAVRKITIDFRRADPPLRP